MNSKQIGCFVWLWTKVAILLEYNGVVHSTVSLHLTTKIVRFGQELEITCQTDQQTNQGFFKWHQNDDALFYDGKPTDYARIFKFSETRSVLLSTLKIHNFNEKDAMSLIGCAYGSSEFVWQNLTKYLELFEYIPNATEMNLTAAFQSSVVFFQLDVQKVFPKIDCTLNKKRLEDKNKKQNGLFFHMTLTGTKVTCDGSEMLECTVGTTGVPPENIPKINCPDIPLVQNSVLATVGIVTVISLCFLLCSPKLLGRFFCHHCTKKSKEQEINESKIELHDKETMTNCEDHREDQDQPECNDSLVDTSLNNPVFTQPTIEKENCETVQLVNGKGVKENCETVPPVNGQDVKGNGETVQIVNEQDIKDNDEIFPLVNGQYSKADEIIHTKEPDKKESLTRTQLLSCLVALAGSMFLYGYNLAVVNNAGKVMVNFIRLTTGFTSEIKVDLIWAATVSCYAVGGVIALPLSRILVLNKKRKPLMSANLVIIIIASGIGCISTTVNSIFPLIVHRLLMGMSCASNLIIAAVYVMEIIDLNQRTHTGLVGTYDQWFQLAVTFGIFIASLLGIEDLLGSKDRWIFLLLFNVGVAIVSLVCLQLCPESPVLLAQKHGESSEATKCLNRLRGIGNTNEDIIKKINENQKDNLGLGQILDHPNYKAARLIVCGLHVFQQLSGINAIIAYSSFIYRDVIVQDKLINLVVVSTMFLYFTTTLYSRWTIYRFGIRHILLVTKAIMAFCFGQLYLLSYLCYDQHSVCPVVAILSIYTFVWCFSIGLGPIPYITVKSLFPEGAQADALNTAVFANWITSSVVLFVFPILRRFIRADVYLILTIALFVMIFIAGNIVPETKEKRGQPFGNSKALSYEEVYKSKWFIYFKTKLRFFRLIKE